MNKKLFGLMISSALMLVAAHPLLAQDRYGDQQGAAGWLPGERR